MIYNCYKNLFDKIGLEEKTINTFKQTIYSMQIKSFKCVINMFELLFV